MRTEQQTQGLAKAPFVASLRVVRFRRDFLQPGKCGMRQLDLAEGWAVLRCQAVWDSHHASVARLGRHLGAGAISVQARGTLPTKCCKL